MTKTPHIKAGSGAECSEVRTRDTVEAIVADMRLIAAGMGGRTGEGLVALADRLQSAHDAETKDLRAELEDARKLLAATSEERDHANRAAESAESRLREAHGLLREADRFLGFEGAEGELSDRIDRAMEGEDGWPTERSEPSA